ncbi:MAG TPA: DUF5915 domain-containing protein, partial [Solirubrobacteraceae bacterium]|nr:DUF5915 domain-containing protein [Solirubrobacteraceae bacterium]
AVQNARKNAGLQVEDRIELWLGGERTLLDAARAHERYIREETLAKSFALDAADAPATDAPAPDTPATNAPPADALAADAHREQTEIDGLTLAIALRRR